MKEFIEDDFNAGAIASRLLKYGVTIKYASGIASEISNLENRCRSKFINKADLDDLIKHHFIRLESKLNSAKIESLKWYIGMIFVQVSGILSVIIAALQFAK